MKSILTTIILFLTGQSLYAAQPKNWQLGYQDSVTSIMDDLVFMHDYILLPIITAISVFVLFLILYGVYKFRASKNPNPSKTTHNTTLEILWTVIPCLILVVIAVPSFKLLYKQDVIPKAGIAQACKTSFAVIKTFTTLLTGTTTCLSVANNLG